MTAKQYEKKTIMSYLCGKPANRKLIPLVRQIENKKVLDVGLGTGYYTKLLLDKNTVGCFDQNPHLCQLPITVHKGDATEISAIVKGEKFDIVLSTWMTEYLNPGQLEKFFAEAKSVLKDDGKLMSTFYKTCGLGFFYVKMAKMLRGVNKYTHPKKEVDNLLKKTGFKNIDFINLNSWLLPWAFLAIANS